MVNKVLIIEDSKGMRTFIKLAVLQAFPGAEILEAENGFQALKLLPGSDVDLIITDINMPDLNGLELISFVKKHPLYQHLPILIVTTEGADDDRKKGLEMGANDYLVKPFSAQELIERIQKVLGHT